MNERTMLQKVSEETMRFMRGKYVLDEVGNGKDEWKLRRENDLFHTPIHCIDPFSTV